MLGLGYVKWLRERTIQLQNQLEATHAAAQEMSKYAFLVDIKREGRSNKFIFMRGNELFEIETMGLISDNPAQWRKDLIE